MAYIWKLESDCKDSGIVIRLGPFTGERERLFN